MLKPFKLTINSRVVFPLMRPLMGAPFSPLVISRQNLKKIKESVILDDKESESTAASLAVR